MDEINSQPNNKCLLLAYYYGRIKLLNCVALQRITQDLISAFESPPDNRSTKYTEPIDGCCLCQEKETLFKELLNQYYENTTTKRSGKEQTEDLEKSWKEVSEMWNRILVQTEGLGKDRPQFNVGQACQNLVEKHGLKVFGEDEYNRDGLDAKWQALTMEIKNKLEACNFAISRIKGETEIPANTGSNVTKLVMRNVYLTLVTKKAARTHAKFMQNCRNVGVQIRAARDPVSVIAKYTMCTLCIRMGNKHKTIELTKLLNAGISYLETNVTLDEFPDTEPTFGEDEKWRRLLKCVKRSASVVKQIEPVSHLVQNNSVSTSVRRSVRVPTAKKKNESFLYYDNGVFNNQEDSSTDEPIKKRRASLPVPLTTPTSSATNLSGTPTFTGAGVTSKNLPSSDESLNVVIVSEERKLTSVVQFNGTTTTSTSLASSIGIFKQQANSPSVMPVPHSLVPSSIDLPLQKVTAPITLAASIAPSCGDGQRKDIPSIVNPPHSPGVNPAQQKAADILTNIVQSLQPRETNQRPLEAAHTPKVIPITPSSLAQLISNPQSQKVIFFQSNNFTKGVDLKKTMMIPLKMNTIMTPTIRSRSVSLDSSPAKNVLFQTNKPKMKTVTDLTVPKPARTTSLKKPFLVHIVNGKIHKPNVRKVTSAAVMKTIPLSRNHVKFVQSVSLKNAIKTFPDPRKLLPVHTRVVSAVSTDSTIPKTLVLGGDMKRGSIMHVGPLSKNSRTSIPQFRLGKSFTFQTKPFPVKRNNNLTRTGADNVLNKVFHANMRPAYENQPKIVSTSAAPSAPKKSNPNYFCSPSKAPSKKKRPPSKSMSTVVAEHIFSLMPSTDPDLWKKLNAKNKRRSEKSSSLIPVPYETNFLCIHDTLDNFGWKAYWYRKCRCSKIREKAAEPDSEHDEPNPMDVAAWVPKKVTENMRKTLNLYVESDDRVSSVGLAMSNSPPKEKLTPTVRVLLEDCDPDCTLEREAKNVQKVNFGEQNTEIEPIDETENIDIETVDDTSDVLNSFSSLKRKPCNLSPETTKKMPILTIKAKYRKDKNGNWTAMVNNNLISDSQKCGNDSENASQSAHISYSHEDAENSVMLNIQPGLSFATGSSTVAMEDRVGTTNDHGIRRCVRATMMRRKALVRRAFDAETRFKTKRERAECSASGSFHFGSFRDESLTNPTFDVVSAHPMCFREEPEFHVKVSSLQAKHLESARALCIKDNTKQAKLYQAGRVEDSVMSLLSSPVCPMLQAKVKRIQSKKSTPVGSNSKTTKGDIVNKLECIWGKTKNVSIRRKDATCSNDASFNKDKVLTENWNLSDWAPKVVNQIFPEVAFTDLQTLRRVPLTIPSTNVISEKSAQFVTTALQVLDRENPVVVLSRPVPKVTPNIKVKTQPQSLISESECLPAWMRKIKSPGKKSKLDVDEILPVESQVETETSPPRMPRCEPTVCEPLENIATLKKENLKEISKSGTTGEYYTDTIPACQNYPVTITTHNDAKNCENGQCEGESENENEPPTPEKVISANRLDGFPLQSLPKTSTLETTILAKSQTQGEISSAKLGFGVAEQLNGEIFSADGLDSGTMSPKKSTKSVNQNSSKFVTESGDLATFSAISQPHCGISSAKLWFDVAEQQNGEIFQSRDSGTMSTKKSTKSVNQEKSAIFVAESTDLTTFSAISQPHGEISSTKLWSDVAEQQNGEIFLVEGVDSGTMSPKATTKSASQESGATFVAESTDLVTFSVNSQPHCEISSAELWFNVGEQQNGESFLAESLDSGTILSKKSTESVNQENCAIYIDKSTDLQSCQDNEVYASTKMENGDFLPLRNHFIFPNQENAISKRQEPENVIENPRTPEVSVITDTGVNEVGEEHENAQNHHKPVAGMVSKTPGELTDFANENNTKIGENLELQQPQCSKDKKHGNLIPTFFAIHRDLRTMWRMSKRGSLAHLSMSKPEKDSIPFKKHLRKKLKASRSLSALLGHRYDLKRVLSRVTKEEKETPKRLGVKGPQNVKKAVKFKSKRLARKSPLSNMLNWIWDVNDDRNVDLAKYMPVSNNAQHVVKTEPKSRESTPETVRGAFFSKLSDSAAKFRNNLPCDFKTYPSPKVHEETTSSEVSEVNLIESSPSSSLANSPKQQRKRRREDKHSLDGMYWSNLLDYEGVEPQLGINLRRRRIADEVAAVDKKILANKRKSSGHGFLMSDFDHASYILQADKTSLKKYNAQKSNAEWEDEEPTILDPLHALLSRSLNVERIRSWIWDSTSPKPMILLTPERSAKRKRPKLLKRRYSENVTPEAISTRDTSQTPNTVETEADSGDWKRCDSNGNDPIQKSEIKDCFADDTERSHVSLMRCSLPQDCPTSLPEKSPPPKKKLFLVRRTEKGTKNSDSSRPIGVTKAAKTGIRRKINFPVLFAKLRKVERKSRNIDEQNKIILITDNAETVVMVDDDEAPQQSSMASGDDVNMLLFETPSSDDVMDGDVSASRKVRSCRLKLVKIEDHIEAHSEHEETKKTDEKRRSTTKFEDGDKTKLQALRETVFAELKRKSNFKGVKTAPDTDRRRPLLQSRCSTKGTFISRLLECDTECLLSNDVTKS